MISSKLIPGGGYGDCLPSGQYVVPIGKNVTTLETSEGALPTIYNPLYVSLSPDGHAWAAQCGNDAAGIVPGTEGPTPNYGGIEYLADEKQWRDIVDATGQRVVVGGTDPCIYDNFNTLCVHPVGPHMSTGGYRFVDEQNNLIDGDATYGPCQEAPRITQWTKRVVNGQTFIAGQGDMGGAAVFDGEYRSLTDPAHVDRLPIDAYAVGIKMRNAGDKLAFYVHQSKVPSSTCLWMDVADIQMLPVYPELVVIPPAVDTFGEIEPPLPEGTSVNMAAHIFPADFARTGTHDLTQVTRPEGRYLMKFGQRTAYELWAEVNGWIHHLEDASAFDRDETYVFTHTPWCPSVMKVGRQYGYTASPHEAIFYRRSTKQEFNRVGFVREMWLWKSYARFDWGPDLGIGPCDIMVYDPTGGAHTDPDETDSSKVRGIETYHFGPGLGRWEYHHSGRVYATGTAQFNDYTRLARSDFYLNGGKVITPLPTGLATTPTTEIPPMEDQKIPAPIQATIQQFAGAFPPPHGDGSESWMDSAYRNPPNGWMAKLCQQLCFSHGPTLGHKRRNSGAPLSAGSFAIKQGDVMQVFDILISVGLGTPTLDLGVDAMTVQLTGPEAQEFVPVPAVNHLDLAPPTDRPGIQMPFWGVTAFDLGAQGGAGDWRFYEQVVLANKLVPRVNIYATINHPQTGRIYRDFAFGMQHMQVLLPRMVADGVKGQFILLVGTGEDADNVSRADALSRIQQMNALLVQFPAAVAGVQIGNENHYPGLEAPYMWDPSFLAEADALIDKRFPVAWGAGHGGQGVSMAGGSYIVHHSDRGLTPDEAGKILAEAKALSKRDVVDDEPRRIEANGGGQSTGSIIFVQGLIDNAKEYKYGLTMHIAAGRGCNVDLLDDVQREAIALIGAEAKAVVVTPPTTPPPPPDDLKLLGEESRASAIKIAYRTLLDRDPDPIGLSIYTDRLKSGWTVPQMEADMKASTEYKEKHPG